MTFSGDTRWGNERLGDTSLANALLGVLYRVGEECSGELCLDTLYSGDLFLDTLVFRNMFLSDNCSRSEDSCLKSYYSWSLEIL